MIENDIEDLQESVVNLEDQVYMLQKYLLQVIIAQTTKELFIVDDMVEYLALFMNYEDYPNELIKKIKGKNNE